MAYEETRKIIVAGIYSGASSNSSPALGSLAEYLKMSGLDVSVEGERVVGHQKAFTVRAQFSPLGTVQDGRAELIYSFGIKGGNRKKGDKFRDAVSGLLSKFQGPFI